MLPYLGYGSQADRWPKHRVRVLERTRPGSGGSVWPPLPPPMDGGYLILDYERRFPRTTYIVRPLFNTIDFRRMPPSDVEKMVERVSWMAPVDYEILLFFEDHDILVSPKVLGANIEYDRQYVSKRCRELSDVGLLNTESTGLYKLTDEGRRFLRGDLDADDLENPNQE